VTKIVTPNATKTFPQIHESDGLDDDYYDKKQREAEARAYAKGGGNQIAAWMELNLHPRVKNCVYAIGMGAKMGAAVGATFGALTGVYWTATTRNVREL